MTDDAPGETAYPIAATVFIIMYKKPRDAARANTAMDCPMAPAARP